MFEYFPDNYSWSLSVMMAVGMGGEISEIDEACRPLKSIAGEPGHDREWFESWAKLGRRVEALAADDERARREWAAARKYLRAATYLLLAERQAPAKDHTTLEVYREGLAAFKRGITLDGRDVEFVEVPYGDKSLPALFLPAQGAQEAAPCMIHFDGLDVMKEIIYLLHLYELPRYSVSVLICDHPGVGEALRLRDLHLTPEVEHPAGACVDYLEGRPDVDEDRVGIMALSLGGYYAPRAAAFEPRLSACVVWGAIWDLGELYELTHDPNFARSVDLEQAFGTVFNVSGQAEIDRVTSSLTIEPFIDMVKCPILTVHGQNDRQAPVFTAERTRDGAVNSPKSDLCVFREVDGGAEHCQLDNVTIGTDYMFDWIATVLHARSSVAVPASSTSA